MTKKEPTEIIKATIGLFQILMASVIVWLFSSMTAIKGELIELRTKQQHIEQTLPKVVEALEKHTEAINELKIVIQSMKR